MLSRSFSRKVDSLHANLLMPRPQDIWIDEENHSFHLFDEEGKALRYKPVPTAEKFHDDDRLVRGMIGPYGSSKTTTMLTEIIFRSCQMPRHNGIRHSRWAIIRNTYAELESTTFVSWMSWFGTLGHVHKNKKPLLTVRHNFDDGKGPIELEVIFIALDSESDVRKLKSLEICGIYINETSEIPYPIFEHAVTRVGRFMLNVYPDYWKGLVFDTNPPNERHWIYKLFELECPKEYNLFHQPPGLFKNEDGDWIPNPECDNIERLKLGYYMRMINNTEEFIKVYALGHYGSVITGKKVYPEYNDDLHSSENLTYDIDLPVYVGLDFGLTPSAVFVQIHPTGQYHVVYEIISESLGIKQFIQEMLLPFLSRSQLKVETYVGDPAGRNRSETDLKSCFDIFGEYGLHILAASTNAITPRLEAVRNALTTLVDGKPKAIVSRKGCSFLREGLLGGYQHKKLKVSNEEVFDSKPDKNQYSHVQDAFQYVMLLLNKQAELFNKKTSDMPVRHMGI